MKADEKKISQQSILNKKKRKTRYPNMPEKSCWPPQSVQVASKKT